MTAPAPERPFLVVTDQTTAEELRETIGLLNDDCKRLRRRGHIGIASEAYKRQHARVNAVLTELEAMT